MLSVPLPLASISFRPLSQVIHTAFVHSIAEKGFALQAENYDNTRPGYAKDVLKCVTKFLEIKRGSRVLEVGAGTGLFTSSLLNLFPNANLAPAYVAVEPCRPMREKFKQKLPNVPVVEGTADSLPVAVASQDAVLVAQAFHWFSNAQTITELSRVLAPGGGVGLLWNMEDGDVPWVARLRGLYEPYDTVVPQYRKGAWRHVFDLPEYKNAFSPPITATFKFSLQASEETIWRRVLTKSYIAVLPQDEQENICQKARNILREEFSQLLSKDGSKILIEYPHTCEVVLFKKLLRE